MGFFCSEAFNKKLRILFLAMICIAFFQEEVFAAYDGKFQAVEDTLIARMFNKRNSIWNNTQASSFSFKSNSIEEKVNAFQYPSEVVLDKEVLLTSKPVNSRAEKSKKELKMVSFDLGDFSLNYKGVLGNLITSNSNKVKTKLKNPIFELASTDDLIGLKLDTDGNIVLTESGINAPGKYIIEVIAIDSGNPDNKEVHLISVDLVEYEVDLSVNISYGWEELFEGDEFEYFITVKNEGFNDAEEVIVFNDLPGKIEYYSSSIESASENYPVFTQIQGDKIIWSTPKLPIDGSLLIKVSGKINSMETNVPRKLENRVGVLSDGIEVSPHNNFVAKKEEILPFFIPNLINPNGDGKNEVFEIKGLDRFVQNHLIIFNNFSDIVFEESDYESNWSAQGLDGGLYYYVLTGIDHNNKTIESKGWLQVIK
jgi:uncharacterized repeat protein (TIGR01451 family)